MHVLKTGGWQLDDEDNCEQELQRLENPQTDIERRVIKVNEIKTLYLLHHNIWDETLLEPPFLFFYMRVLAPRERQVVDWKLQGLSDEQVAQKMGIKTSAVAQYVYNIRYIYRNKSRNRVYRTWRT